MPSYLVEAYVADRPEAIDEAFRCALLAARLGPGVRHLRTTVVPEDETMLHLFEAPSLEVLLSGEQPRRPRAPAHRRGIRALGPAV